MSGNLRLNGKTSGYSQLAAPDKAGDQTFTFPTTGGTLAIASNNTAGVPVPGYQQGTWTPKLALTPNGTSVASDYKAQVGKWARLGNLVVAQFHLQLNSSTGLTSTSTALCIIDFPYKCISASGYYGAASGFHANGWATKTTTFVNTLMSENTSRTIGIYFSTSDQTNNYFNVTFDHLGTGGNIIGQMTYLTDNTDWKPSNGATVDS